MKRIISITICVAWWLFILTFLVVFVFHCVGELLGDPYDFNHDGQVDIKDYTELRLQQIEELNEMRDIILEVQDGD